VALRILLGTRHQFTRQHRPDRPPPRSAPARRHRGDLARATLTDPVLLPGAAAGTTAGQPRQAVRAARTNAWALAGRHALTANRDQLQTIVDEMPPGLTERRGVGVVTAARAVVSFSHPGPFRSDAAFAALSGTSSVPAQQRQVGPAPAQPRRR